MLVEDRLVGGDDVFLLDVLRRVHELLGQLAVVREDQQAFRVAVEAADVVEVLQDGREDGVDRVPTQLVLARTDVAARLEEHDRAGLLLLHALAIDADEVARLDAVGGVEDRLAVDFDMAFLHQRVTGAAGTDAAGGEVFVEAGSFGHDGERWLAGVQKRKRRRPLRDLRACGIAGGPGIRLRPWSWEGRSRCGLPSTGHAP